MSKASKSQLIYFLRILECCGKIQVYLKGFTDFADFFHKDEQLHFNATLTLLIQIGEQTIKIDDVLKNKSGYIPWTMIKGLRNIAVHEYQYVDAEKIYQICTSHIPQLQQNVEHFIKESIKVNQLSAFELKLSEGSEFYTHIRFKNLVDS